jgi:hypothetical protein
VDASLARLLETAPGVLVALADTAECQQQLVAAQERGRRLGRLLRHARAQLAEANGLLDAQRLQIEALKTEVMLARRDTEAVDRSPWWRTLVHSAQMDGAGDAPGVPTGSPAIRAVG